MKTKIVNILNSVPGGPRLVEAYMKWRGKDPETVFTHYYTTSSWGSKESVSGEGSEVARTELIRKEIPRLIAAFGVKKILDAPCGDYNWFRLIPRERSVNYLGADIVKPLIEENKRRFKNENTDFIQLDITQDKLPDADLLICRDCLIHLSYDNIFRAVANILRSDIRYFLTSTNKTCERNANIVTGKCRPLNLQLPPFNFCEPLELIDDQVKITHPSKLGLWDVKVLRAELATNIGVMKGSL